jgi:hypothetical protein
LVYNCSSNSGDLSTEFKLRLKVTVTGLSGCRSSAEHTSGTLTGNPDPTLTIAPTTPVPYCADATSAIVKFNIATDGALLPPISAVPSVSGVECVQDGSPKTLGGEPLQGECSCSFRKARWALAQLQSRTHRHGAHVSSRLLGVPTSLLCV